MVDFCAKKLLEIEKNANFAKEKQAGKRRALRLASQYYVDCL